MENNETKTVRVMLCEGRHEIPEAADGAIFNVIEDVTDFSSMRQIADRFFRDKCGATLNGKGFKCNVEIYVTGLTMALIEVINSAMAYGALHQIVLKHYDTKTGAYISQKVGY